MGNIIAIVGRPNVGKSTLFNRLIGARQSIVDDVSGVTRDRQYGTSIWNGKEFTVVDTGGFVKKTDDIFEKESIDAIIHAAYVLTPIHDKTLMEDINKNGTKNILEAGQKARVKQILYLLYIGFANWRFNRLTHCIIARENDKKL